MTETGDTLRLNELYLSESTEHFLKKVAAFLSNLAVKLEYDIYSVSVNCIPTSPPILESLILEMYCRKILHFRGISEIASVNKYLNIFL